LAGAHWWQPARWLRMSVSRVRQIVRGQVSQVVPDFSKVVIRKRYMLFTPRAAGFREGDQFFFESAVEQR
jgi:hypothetical protein